MDSGVGSGLDSGCHSPRVSTLGASGGSQGGGQRKVPPRLQQGERDGNCWAVCPECSVLNKPALRGTYCTRAWLTWDFPEPQNLGIGNTPLQAPPARHVVEGNDLLSLLAVLTHLKRGGRLGNRPARQKVTAQGHRVTGSLRAIAGPGTRPPAPHHTPRYCGPGCHSCFYPGHRVPPPTDR